jgi:hypothetical protein
MRHHAFHVPFDEAQDDTVEIGERLGNAAAEYIAEPAARPPATSMASSAASKVAGTMAASTKDTITAISATATMASVIFMRRTI